MAAGIGGTVANIGTQAGGSALAVSSAATTAAAGVTATTAAGGEATAAMANMTALAAIQNQMALNKGVLELGKEGSKAMSTFMADSGKAATAQ